MYCYHCGLKIDEHAIEAKKSSFADITDEVNDETVVQYVCPRCGAIIHSGMSKEEAKELSRASHAQIQRGNNNAAVGMSMVAIGAILLAIAILFYFLAKKPAHDFVLQVNCAEFYVFVILGIISVILLGVGGGFTFFGHKKKQHYSSLLKDINNKTFVQ